MLEAVRLVTEHPVTSFADIQRKIQVTDDAGLFDCYGEPEDNARECIFRDIRALGADETTTSLAGKGGYFNDTGFPVGNGWDEIDVPGVTDNTAYALEITGDSMLPVYREGDTIIVSPGATVRKGDRVVVKTTDGQVMATIMQRQTAKNVELASFNAAHDTKTLDMKDVDWMARIIWASQ
ncbi:MAG: helix-turn-helix transcriptional regulator [Hyphomicrobiales bacterium]|nr:helix-turn-helix transcriptional regulator [Hyphomicrobiales bacterium]